MSTYHSCLLLALAWISWCGLHSLLIHPRLLRFFETTLKDSFRYYRLAYNIFSAVSLILPVGLSFHLQQAESPVLSWASGLFLFRLVLIGSALLLFFSGAGQYDMRAFLGIEQLRLRDHHKPAPDKAGFSTTGVSELTRHPWYLGGILFVWAAPSSFYPSTLISSGIVTLYFLVGIFLEERKLVDRFGKSYLAYQKEVSMLLPLKWCRKQLKKRIQS